MVALLALGIRALAGAIEDDQSTLQQITGIWGTTVSGIFLVAIGLINLAALVGILKVFRKMRTGRYVEAELEEQLNKRGFLNRILGRVTRTVTKPWHMYPVGLLFGLGFDTVTEVGLLVVAGGAAASGLPWWAILTLPVLFAAGMSLLDSIDGSFMNFAYGWAFARPVRKIYYNITVTALSVAVALLIGGLELFSVLSEKLGLTSGVVASVGAIDLEYVGYWIVGLFVVTWVVALLVWRLGRIEERWSANLQPAD
jgi:high-affinity nickel-transport protein